MVGTLTVTKTFRLCTTVHSDLRLNWSHFGGARLRIKNTSEFLLDPHLCFDHPAIINLSGSSSSFNVLTLNCRETECFLLPVEVFHQPSFIAHNSWSLKRNLSWSYRPNDHCRPYFPFSAVWSSLTWDQDLFKCLQSGILPKSATALLHNSWPVSFWF